MKSGYKVILLLFSTLFLWACGGGGDINEEGSDGGSTDKSFSITVESSASSISKSTPATLTATVVNSSNRVQPNKVVTFSLSDENMGTFSVANRKVATDSEGKATIQLATGSIAGATTVTVTLDEDETVSATAVVTMVGDGGDVSSGAQIAVTLTDDNGNEIQAITATQPATVTATVTGINQATIVTFESTIGDLPIKTAVTDNEGRASVTIFAGSSLGAGKVQASIESGEEGDAVVVVGATDLVMGSGSPFVSERADVSVVQLSAGGTATVSVQIQDENGNPYTQPIDVNFSSRCSSNATAQAEISSPIPTVNGVATTTYLAKGCVGDDPINVTANAGGLNLTASGIINVLPANVGSVSFLSAEPEMLTLKGTGSSETSIIKFQVLDANGNPVNNREVNFSLNTNVGSIEINPSSATTNSEGIVQTVVSSGDVATSIRVTAEIADSNPRIIGQSSQLVVSTGLPDQDSFSLSASIPNPEALNIQNAAVTIQARLADAFNNPAPDGTVVYFTTEGGSIDSSCQTVNGICEVEWRSQLPEPVGTFYTQNLDVDGNPVISGGDYTFSQYDGVLTAAANVYRDELKPKASLNDAAVNDDINLLQCTDSDQSICAGLEKVFFQSYVGGNYYQGKYGGRVTITATAIGEESFPDTNGNGRFDESEATTFLNQPNVSGLPFDLADPFNDYNEDGIFNPQVDILGVDPRNPSNEITYQERVGGELEELISFSFDPATQDGEFDFADGKYNGVLCALNSDGTNAHQYCANGVDEPKSTYIRRSIVIVMSGSTAFATPQEEVMVDDDDAIELKQDNVIDIHIKSSGSVTFTISDINNQQMPAGSVVRFNSTVGTVATSSIVWPSSSHNGGRDFTVTIKAGDEVESGQLLVTVEAPSGLISEVLSVPINIINPPLS